MESKQCINCQSELTGEYCSQCGQHATVKRITLKVLLGEYFGRLFGMDTKFLRTVKDLTINPGIVARTYIDGNRVKYMGPVAYFFIVSTLYILSFSVMGVDIKEFIISGGGQVNSAVQADQVTERQQMFQQQFTGLIAENMRIFSFLIIPFFGIAGRFFYRKSGLNLLEHTVNGFYVFGQTTILTILSVVVYGIYGQNFTVFLTLVMIPYYMWVTVKFYKKKGFWQWIKTLVVFLVSYLMFLLALMTLVLVGLFLYVKFVDPNFLS